MAGHLEVGQVTQSAPVRVQLEGGPTPSPVITKAEGYTPAPGDRVLVYVNPGGDIGIVCRMVPA